MQTAAVVLNIVEVNPKAASERLRAIEELITQEQRELRTWVEKLQSSLPVSIASSDELTAALNKLRERAQWQWGFRIEVNVDGRGAVSRVLGDQIYRLVQEALTNVGRHARPTAARVRIKLDGGSSPVHLIISDDGCGFPFRGSFDLAELTRRGIGPRSLRERVTSLRGDLVLTSELCGSRLEISLPANQPLPRSPVRKLANG